MGLDTFGQWLYHIRESRRLTRLQFSKMIGVTTNHVRLIEDEQVSPPRPKTVKAICLAFGLDTHQWYMIEQLADRSRVRRRYLGRMGTCAMCRKRRPLQRSCATPDLICKFCALSELNEERQNGKRV